MMHLYVDGRVAFPASAAWAGMDFFLHQKDVQQLFLLGGRPRTLPECAKKWLLAQGNTLSDINRPSFDVLKSYRGYVDGASWRPLRDSSVLGALFPTRIHACDEHCLTMPHDNFKAQIQTMHSRPALSRLATQLNVEKHRKQDLVDTWAARLHSWTLSDILELTQPYLAVDLADVGFDWRGLHDTCASMRDQVAPAMPKNTARKDEERDPIRWTTTILCDVAEAERCARKKKTSLQEGLKKSANLRYLPR